MSVYMCEQPFVKPIVNRFDSPLDNRLYRLYKHTTGFDNRLDVCLHDAAGCPTGCTTSLTTGCMVQTGYYVTLRHHVRVRDNRSNRW